VDLGYVEAYASDPVPERGGRRKILYRLTLQGKDALLKAKEIHSALWLDIPRIEDEG
jgi:hypothetical protein